jgi:hypothetical protein
MSRFFVGLTVTLLAFAGVSGVASATQDPPSCNANDVIVQLDQSPAPPYAPGQTINYAVYVGNDDPVTIGCNAIGVDVTVVTPDGAPHTVVSGASYPFVSTVQLIGSVPYTVNLADATAGACGKVLVCPQLTATVTATGMLQDSASQDDPFTFSKQLSSELAWTHYLCWQLHDSASGLAPVSAVDQFGSTTIRPLRLHEICNPADKNDEDPGALTNSNHLTAYIASAPTGPGSGKLVKVTNQFGTLGLKIRQVRTLLVPASKSISSPPPPLSPVNVDHFVCYVTNGTTIAGGPFVKTTNVKVQDEFGTITVNTTRVASFCTPADINGGQPGAENDPITLLCYRVKPLVRVRPPTPVYANDDFGAHTLLPDGNIVALCVPSLMTVVG